jgi:hypothetical protein
MQKVVGSSPLVRLKAWKTPVFVFDSDYIAFCVLGSGQWMCPSGKTLQ